VMLLAVPSSSFHTVRSRSSLLARQVTCTIVCCHVLQSDQDLTGSLSTCFRLQWMCSHSGKQSHVKMEDIVSLCKRKGFVFQSSEIYSPMAGFYDYGPLGVELRNNIKKIWWRDMVQRREDIVGLDSSIIASPAIWNASGRYYSSMNVENPVVMFVYSGHITGFSDPMVDCKKTKLRFRADQVFWGALQSEDGGVVTYVSTMEADNMLQTATSAALKKAKSLGHKGPFLPIVLKDLTEASADIYPLIPSPGSGEAGDLTPPRDFNLMFQTSVGAVADASAVAYLRPETAQVSRFVVCCSVIFVNSCTTCSHCCHCYRAGYIHKFQGCTAIRENEGECTTPRFPVAHIQPFNFGTVVVRTQVPFGIAQIGKAFRNEITPRNFVFRSREFEQMEIEYFIPPEDSVWPQVRMLVAVLCRH
jgi:glycyl-tRNA synthetase